MVAGTGVEQAYAVVPLPNGWDYDETIVVGGQISKAGQPYYSIIRSTAYIRVWSNDGGIRVAYNDAFAGYDVWLILARIKPSN